MRELHVLISRESNAYLDITFSLKQEDSRFFFQLSQR